MYYGVPTSLVEKFVSLCAACQLRRPYIQVQSMYYGVPRSVVEKFVSLCATCQLRRPQVTTGPLKPIVANVFLSRLQVCILYFYFRGWTIGRNSISPMAESKHAVDVANALNTNVFPYFGVPRIMHSDNGREFINQVIEHLLQSWHSDIQLVSGRPRHPQSQGLVERAHYTLERKLTSEIHRAQMKQPPWSQWLPRIVCKLQKLSTDKYEKH